MKNDPLIIRQFYYDGLDEFNHLFVKHNNGYSEYTSGPNLFGWGEDSCRKYTRKFQLVVVYG